MAELVEPCIECGRIYNKSKLSTCPGCSALRQDDATKVPSLNKSSKSAFAENTSDNELLTQLVNEAMLTRRATQSTATQLAAFASFVWISTVTGIIAGFFYAMATINADYDGRMNSSLAIIAVMVAIIGSIVALAALFEAARARLTTNMRR